ncbi:hypothetical protein I8748_25940 [Nostoc sp. CENA67]|uniref:Uncharacterized protein n=1 Tax=Amazonocrinis nigriterrae CENA67 TaxID=2794033 RepID=A0A8J7HTA1_9NOST|nr:hypothetical protein [Amazonocrinis nigriterrae]MBH8565573.1 hypothetical protein [Amazonocrinis nigriterrae CENA67]
MSLVGEPLRYRASPTAAEVPTHCSKWRYAMDEAKTYALPEICGVVLSPITHPCILEGEGKAVRLKTIFDKSHRIIELWGKD